MSGVRVLVVSDTHSPRRWHGLPDGLVEPLRRADVVLHAGDVCEPSVLETLAS